MFVLVFVVVRVLVLVHVFVLVLVFVRVLVSAHLQGFPLGHDLIHSDAQGPHHEGPHHATGEEEEDAPALEGREELHVHLYT